MRQTQPLGKSNFQSAGRSTVTADEMFRLWRAAIKDDASFVDAMIDKIYAEMIAFDSERIETVMELTVKRRSAAKRLFKDLLHDVFSGDR